MTDGGARAPLRRPATARQRTADAAGPAPSPAELEAIERQLAGLPAHSGASVAYDDALEALLVRHAGRGPAQNFAAHVRWRDDAIDERLAALEVNFRAADEWPAMIVTDASGRPAPLVDQLSRRGWRAVEAESVMWTRRPPVVPHLDPQTRLEGTTRRTAAEHEELERDVFGLLAEHAAERVERLSEAVESGALRGFMVRLHGEAVAVARVALGDGVAGIYGVGVAARRRRQGFGALVTAIATRSGLATGDRLVWLSVSEGNAPALALYRALGYQPAFSWSRWLAPAP